MYNSKLVASLKANGKILREFKDTVYIPFGSEYSILIKNLNTVRAVVNIYVDGDDVVPGGLVVMPGQEIDLERSIKNGNLTTGNKFKFIERTGSVEQHRGIKLEDGIVRIEYQFERVYQRQDGIMWTNTNTNYQPFNFQGGSISTSVNYSVDSISSVVRSVSSEYTKSATASASVPLVNTVMHTATTVTPSVNDAGITVPGSKSDQKFSNASWFPTQSEKHSIVLKLLGETADNVEVQKPITTKFKPKCITCGKQNKVSAKFCAECGTALTIFS